ncbi:macrolide ABC transporter ATP-binding protein [Thermoplasmatales archaeon SW_10_69_26]|nr:MAG: macrolide ABC transporter ATP-binding protein [Thermoplasmatales archaeon SW_10_69_26]
MTAPLVSARGLERTYSTEAGEVHALRGVDVDIDAGQVVAILGPSGCGKTTLLNCLSGIDVPTAGRVRFDDRQLDELADDARTDIRSQRMGFVFQAFNLVQVLTAVENVEMPLLLDGHEPDPTRETAQAALDRVGLGDRTEHLPNQLSGGEQQRVALARSLVNEPEIVWADEPTGDLDRDTGLRVLDLMAELNEELGQTYVIVTHDDKVLDYADRVLHMESGKLVREEATPG